MEPLDWAFLPFKRYFDFAGRSSRAEYWYYTALIWFASLLILFFQLVLGQAGEGAMAIVNGLFGLATFVPSLAVAVRRLHDINRSGFVLLKYLAAIVVIAVLIPGGMFLGAFVGGLLWLALTVVCVKFLILMVIEGDRGPNPYGPNPYGLTYGY